MCCFRYTLNEIRWKKLFKRLSSAFPPNGEFLIIRAFRSVVQNQIFFFSQNLKCFQFDQQNASKTLATSQ